MYVYAYLSFCPAPPPVFCHVNVPKQSFIFNFSKTGPSAVSCWHSRLPSASSEALTLHAGSLLHSTPALLHLRFFHLILLRLARKAPRHLQDPQRGWSVPGSPLLSGAGLLQVKLHKTPQVGRAEKNPCSPVRGR